MAYSVTIEQAKRKPDVILRSGTENEAKAGLAALARNWCLSKKGRCVKHVGMETRLLWSDGKMAALIVVDPLAEVAA